MGKNYILRSICPFCKQSTVLFIRTYYTQVFSSSSLWREVTRGKAQSSNRFLIFPAFVTSTAVYSSSLFDSKLLQYQSEEIETMQTLKSKINFISQISIIAALYAFSSNTVLAESSVQSFAEASSTPNPYIGGRTLIDGIVSEVSASSEIYKSSDVYGCCSASNEESTCSDADQSCQDDDDVLKLAQSKIGSMPQFTKEQSMQVLESAKTAWSNGAGTWPQMTLKDRIAAIETFIEELKKSRDDIATILMWEIGKNRKDAYAEFDRTIIFVEQSIAAIQSESNTDFDCDFRSIGSTRAFLRRAAIGIIMCLGPYNYPLNETYATLIPALLMGNIVIMKVPTIGGLAHLITSKLIYVTNFTNVLKMQNLNAHLNDISVQCV